MENVLSQQKNILLNKQHFVGYKMEIMRVLKMLYIFFLPEYIKQISRGFFFYMSEYANVGHLKVKETNQIGNEGTRSI
jgi:hypothetical protein